MNSKLLSSKKYPPKCEYCLKGRPSPDNKSIFCIKNGIMAPDDRCKSFKYDVLKREPKKQAVLPENDPRDFEL